MATLKLGLISQNEAYKYNNNLLTLEYTYPNSATESFQGGRSAQFVTYGWIPLLVKVVITVSNGHDISVYFAFQFYDDWDHSSYIKLGSSASFTGGINVNWNAQYNVLNIDLTSATPNTTNLKSATIYNCVMPAGNCSLLVNSNGTLSYNLYGPGLVTQNGDDQIFKMAVPIDVADYGRTSAFISTDNEQLTVNTRDSSRLCYGWVLGAYQCCRDDCNNDTPAYLSNGAQALISGSNVLTTDGIRVDENQIVWDPSHYTPIIMQASTGDINYGYESTSGRWSDDDDTINHQFVGGVIPSTSNYGVACAITWAPWVFWDGSKFTR